MKNRIREMLKGMLERILEEDADEQVGAVRYERWVTGRKDYRNGYRRRWLGTSLGSVELRVPRARQLHLNFSVFSVCKRRWLKLDDLSAGWQGAGKGFGECVQRQHCGPIVSRFGGKSEKCQECATQR